jgi:hypothetical protein
MQKIPKIPSVQAGKLEIEDGASFKVESQRWFKWLESHSSFRYAPASSNAPYTCRKEKANRGEADYWYGYRKVAGKLHKRYLGRTSDLTVGRLEEVAALLDIPAQPRQKKEVTEKVTDASSVTSSMQEEVVRLQEEVARLHKELQIALGKSIA